MSQKDETTEVTSNAPAATPGIPTEVIELDTPLQRGTQTVEKITLRKPLAGALRGTALADVLNMDVNALIRVLPRITEPALSEAEIRNMDPADLVQLGGAVSSFLLAKKFKATDE